MTSPSKTSPSPLSKRPRLLEQVSVKFSRHEKRWLELYAFEHHDSLARMIRSAVHDKFPEMGVARNGK